MGMMYNYSRDNSVATAIAMTFDGDHPCPMCKNIRKAQTDSAADAKLSGLQQEQARDHKLMPATAVNLLPRAHARLQIDTGQGSFPGALAAPPLTPPPIRA